MKIRVLGAGIYGCHIAAALIRDGHEVEVHEIAANVFAGASGAMPGRLHIGTHYPRSRLTRAACQEHASEFMSVYGHLTRAVPVNIYAVAQHDSLLDFGTYCQVLKGEIEFVRIHDPAEFGLANVEGAILTGERHIVIRKAREFFGRLLDGHVRFGQPIGDVDDPAWDWTIDCTFCALDQQNIERFEPCVTGLLRGLTHKAVTIMDGPFGSIYPWDEEDEISSLTHAGLTPLSKSCRTYEEAREMLDSVTHSEIVRRCEEMLAEVSRFWPGAARFYNLIGYRMAIRAMPRSAADMRLIDVVDVGKRALRVRAGKIDAVFHAERIIKERIAC